MSRVVVYGATGFTGRLVARAVRDRGLEVVVAGRNPTALQEVARELGAEVAVAPLDDRAALDAALDGAGALVNAAGPFARTQAPLVEACLRTGVPYADLAGELPEHLAVRAYDEQARRAGVPLLPGAGFGVVPTDALAVHLARRLPGAVRLEIAYETVGGVSRGTAGTVLPGAHRAGWQRDGGELRSWRPADGQVRMVVAGRERVAVTNPWRADLVAAGTSTGIPDVRTFSVFPRPVVGLMRAGRRFGRVLDSRAWQGLLGAMLRRLPEGPDDAALEAGRSDVWGRATAADGTSVVSTLSGPEAYVWTAATASLVAELLAKGGAPAGYTTPGAAFGPDVVLETPGVERHDVS